MSFLKKAYITVSSVPGFHLGVLICMMLLSFGIGVALSVFDAATVRLYFDFVDVVYLKYDLLFVAFTLFLIGYLRRRLGRNKGYGSVFILSLLLLLLTGILYGVESKYALLSIHLLFISKYAVFTLFTTALLLSVPRYIPLRLGSLKRLAIMGSLFLGFAFGGFSVFALSLGAYSALYVSFVLLLIAYFSLYLLANFVPVEKEVFLTKTGAVRDLSELKLVRSIYSFCFLFFVTRGICDYLFYVSLAHKQDLYIIWKNILCWWGFLGLFGFLSVVVLFRTRYFYMISGGIVLFILGVLNVVVGSYFDWVLLTFLGMVLVSFAMFLYFEDFVSALLRILNQGIGKSINKRRWSFIEPAGFLFGILAVIYLHSLPIVLLGVAGLLVLLGLLALKFYSTLLMQLLTIRAWRGGPLLLLDKNVLSYIQSHLVSDNVNDVTYFLRVLEISNKWLYLKWLLKSLKHKEERIRLYALEKISGLYNVSRYEKSLELVFLRDSSIKVRCRALSILIQIAYENKALNGINGFLPYLDDKKLKIGAMSGFLRTEGAPALLSIDGLQKLVDSKKVKDNLLALSIMDWAPSVGLIRLLMKLLKSNNTLISGKALLIAAKIAHPECLPIILTSLDDVALRENALVALKGYGISAFPAIERMINNPETPAVRLKTLILFLTMLPSGEGKQVLLRSLQIGNQKLRKTIIQGMIDSGIFWIHKNKYSLLLNGIQKDVNRILWLSDLMQKYKRFSFKESSEAFAFLVRAIKEDIDETRETILYQLLLLKDNNLFIKAVHVLLSPRNELYDVALSSLQDMMPKKLYKLLKIALLDTKKEELSVLQIETSVEEAVSEVSKLLIDPPFLLPNWIKATALYCLRFLDTPQSLSVVKKYLKSKNALVLEAAIWAFCKLEKQEDVRHQILLSVPTSQLVLQSFDTMLEN